MIPEFPKFKSIDENDFNEILFFLKGSAANICELNLANLFIWKDFDRPEASIINGNLCIRINSLLELPYFLEPLGQNKIEETIAICLSHSKKLSRISENFVKNINKEKYKICCIRPQFDYIYSTEELSELKGKKYDGKRNHIKKFTRLNPEVKIVEIKKEDKTVAVDLFEKWFTEKQYVRYFSKMAHDAQKSAVSYAFDYIKELNIRGSALFSGNTLACFMLGSPINKNVFSAHFHYCNPNFQGAQQVMLSNFCSKIKDEFKMINLEQDLGIQGIRHSKMSYHPLKIEKKFEITPKI